MSHTIQVHPFSVALGAISVACAGLLAGGGGVAGPPSPLDFMSVVQLDDGFGNMIDTVRFTGCNVQVANGLGETETINGAGNLIVGYNESSTNDRTGSHNIVGGNANDYSSYGGLVVGWNNVISGVFASVSGGGGNEASGGFSSVSGGNGNVASGVGSSVSGGGPAGPGGGGNVASGNRSSVSGGTLNEASGNISSISGGVENLASGYGSSVSGGAGNTASRQSSSISGGCNQITDQECQHLPCNQCPADANLDGVVDVQDFLQVILAWGAVCP